MSAAARPYGPNEFRDQFDVSRETLDRLDAYAATLRKWQPRINLISNQTLDAIWWRHFADSAQIVEYLRNDERRLVDLGSGAGFPGLVIKAMRPETKVTLIESDQRKVAFLRAAALAMDVKVNVLARRIESLAGDADRPVADVVTARALAPLPQLLDLAAIWIGDNPRFLLLKGQNVESELISAAKCWTMDLQQIQSVTQSDARLLCIERLARVET